MIISHNVRTYLVSPELLICFFQNKLIVEKSDMLNDSVNNNYTIILINNNIICDKHVIIA